MPRFAHVSAMQVLDPRSAASVGDYNALWTAGQLSEWSAHTFKRVGDDTEHGAKDNGDGTFTNPIVYGTPRILTKTQFQDYAVSQLGSGLSGMARFTEIMDATRDSASGAVRFAFARYEAASVFEKTNTATLTAIMASDSQAGHITAIERAAILNNWPEI